MRKVVEVIYPALHEKIIEAAHTGHIKVNLLSSVMLAYALENMPDVLHNAERLCAEWEQKAPTHTPVMRIVRTLRKEQ